MLGLFHLYPLPFLSMNPYARGLLPSEIHPDNPKFNFLAIKDELGFTYSHRPDSKQKDYPIWIVCTGWNPEIHTPNQIQRTLYSLDLEMHESAVFPPQKRRDSTAPALCHIVYTKMTNLLWSCIYAGGGFIRGIPLSCKVAVGTGDTTLGKYHYWGDCFGRSLAHAPPHLHVQRRGYNPPEHRHPCESMPSTTHPQLVWPLAVITVVSTWSFETHGTYINMSNTPTTPSPQR